MSESPEILAGNVDFVYSEENTIEVSPLNVNGIDILGALEELQSKLNYLESRLTKVENAAKPKRLLRPE